MRPLEFLALYLVFGLVVGVASARAGRPGAWMCVPLWPLFLPGLLADQAPPLPPIAQSSAGSTRIEHAVQSLRAALLAWDGLPDRDRCLAAVAGLQQGLTALALREAQLQGVLDGLDAPEVAPAQAVGWALQRGRLVALREETRAALERGLGGAAELAARVHLARLSGEPAASVLRALAELAAAVEAGQEVASMHRGEV